jgi:hypothetical protein
VKKIEPTIEKSWSETYDERHLFTFKLTSAVCKWVPNKSTEPARPKQLTTDPGNKTSKIAESTSCCGMLENPKCGGCKYPADIWYDEAVGEKAANMPRNAEHGETI